MTKRELINTYLSSIGRTLVQGDSTEPLLPFLLGDAIYTIYNRDIAPLDLRQEEKRLRSDWAKNYTHFNRPFFAAIGGEGSDQGCTTEHGTAAVGSYRPNAWGLYDMHGNAWEWCLDWHGDLADGATDPVGSNTVTHRIVRGGSWVIKRAEYCSSGSRHRASPSIGRFRGFRLVLNSK